MSSCLLLVPALVWEQNPYLSIERFLLRYCQPLVQKVLLTRLPHSLSRFLHPPPYP